MDSTQNVTWNRKLWDVISLLYWAPKYIGLKSISKDKYPSDFPSLQSLMGVGYRLYGRSRKFDETLEYLNGQEEVLNCFVNIALAIAPDEVLSRLLCAPLAFRDSGPFESFGGELAIRYGWGKNENVTQPDGFFATSKSLVAVEMKLDSSSWPEQIAKYVALMRWEQIQTGERDNLGLLFILPENSLKPHWTKILIKDSSESGNPNPPITIRRCPPDFFEKLDQDRKLPRRVRQLFESNTDQIKSDFERLRLRAVSWAWLRSEISKIESELDCSIRGDQTLKRLLVGLRSQIEGHGKTGIAAHLTSRGPAGSSNNPHEDSGQ